MNTDNLRFKHKSSVQLRFNDFDILGHANNAIYQQYFDLARMDYFNTVIGNRINWPDFSVILASIKIDYFVPVFITESIAVRTCITYLGNKSLKMIQEILNDETNEIKAVNKAVMVGFSAKTNQTMPIPSHWKKMIFNFEDKVEIKTIID